MPYIGPPQPAAPPTPAVPDTPENTGEAQQAAVTAAQLAAQAQAGVG